MQFYFYNILLIEPEILSMFLIYIRSPIYFCICLMSLRFPNRPYTGLSMKN